MRLVGKTSLLLLLVSVFTSSLMAGVHCIDLPGQRTVQSTSVHVVHEHDNDCNVHAEGISATFANEKKVGAEAGKSIAASVMPTPLLAAVPYLISAIPDSPPPALPLALSSILRI